MHPQNVVAMPRQQPALIDRLRATLREVNEDLETRPDYLAAREFRHFLVGAIHDLESKQLDTAA
ncbi:MAG TPA: hypothetical protein VII58_04120 [Acidobacteriaceae bacterium]